MPYQEVTMSLIGLSRKATSLIIELTEASDEIHIYPERREKIIAKARMERTNWAQKCLDILLDNGLEIEGEGFLNMEQTAMIDTSLDSDLSKIKFFLVNKKKFLIDVAKDIENKKEEKEVISIKIDDIENFTEIREIGFSEVKDFTNSVFLEDDVEEAFLEKLGEPYKELDSGAETRDLFTDKIIVNGKRLNTAIMFKGRGVKGSLSLDRCGSKGSQLLKLAKNNAAECFIVQHVNKIEPDVKETLFDLVRMNSRFRKVYVGFIDGTDTARLLKSLGKNLEELRNKKSQKSK